MSVHTPPRTLDPADALDRDVADHLGVSHGQAREIVRTFVAVLPRHLPDDVVAHLATYLPEPLGDLLEDPGLVDGATRSAPSDLKMPPDPSPTGRPAHPHSVANPHPHHDTKISSGRGATDLRGETIGFGRATSDRPIHSAPTPKENDR